MLETLLEELDRGADGYVEENLVSAGTRGGGERAANRLALR